MENEWCQKDAAQKDWHSPSPQLPNLPIASVENSDASCPRAATPTQSSAACEYSAIDPGQPNLVEHSAVQRDCDCGAPPSFGPLDNFMNMLPEDVARVNQAQQGTVDAFVQAVAEGSVEHVFLLLDILSEAESDSNLVSRPHSQLDLCAAALAGSSASTEHELLFQVLLLVGAYVPEDAIRGFMIPGWLPLTTWAKATARRFINGDLSGLERAQTLLSLRPDEVAAYLAQEITETDQLDASEEAKEHISGPPQPSEAVSPGWTLPDEPRWSGSVGHPDQIFSPRPVAAAPLPSIKGTPLEYIEPAVPLSSALAQFPTSGSDGDDASNLGARVHDVDDDASSVSSFATLRSQLTASGLASEFSAFELVDGGVVSRNESDVLAARSFVHLRLEDAESDAEADATGTGEGHGAMAVDVAEMIALPCEEAAREDTKGHAPPPATQKCRTQYASS
ncbi:hypothetical protein JCM3770_006627 [Rhodotorula araucariae]